VKEPEKRLAGELTLLRHIRVGAGVRGKMQPKHIRRLTAHPRQHMVTEPNTARQKVEVELR
jgi:hypothetical protein